MLQSAAASSSFSRLAMRLIWCPSKDGTVDLDHLKELIREDTILVSINYVDSELGVCQPIESISAIVATYPNCFFHVDATQAVGKITVDFDQIDLVTFCPNKFFGLNGMGVLLKKRRPHP